MGAGGRSPEGHLSPVEEGREGWRWQGNRDREGLLQVSRRWEGAAAFSLEAGPPDCVDGDEKCVRAVGGAVGPPWRGPRACGGLLGGPQGRTRSVRRRGLETDSVAEEHGHVSR